MEQLLLGLLLLINTITRDNLLHTLSTLNLIFGMPGIESQTIKYGIHLLKETGLNKVFNNLPIKIVLNI